MKSSGDLIKKIELVYRCFHLLRIGGFGMK